MALELEPTFDRLPSELLDVITNNVRQTCPKSFQTLERTSRGLRDSARRCSKTLIVAPLKRGKSSCSHEQIEGGPSVNLKLPKEILVEEFSLRPGLVKLVITDTSYRSEEEHCEFSILKTLTIFPWEDVEIEGTSCGQLCKSSCRTTWEDEYPKKIVSACASNLKDLVITGFDFRYERTVVSFLERFPKLETLTLEGLSMARHDLRYDFDVKHESLATLNIAGLFCPYLGVFLAPEYQQDVESSFPLISAKLPSLRHLSATVFDAGSRLSSRRFCPSPLMVEVPGFTFPSTLRVVELYWRHFSYEDFRPASVIALLERDCPQLQELHVKLDTPSSKNARERTLQWISEQGKLRIPEGCPELRELSFEISENGGKWARVKSLSRFCKSGADGAGSGLGD